jgi:uncharacterized membrane protein YcgQ (UPF0703/DUF1980 family)
MRIVNQVVFLILMLSVLVNWIDLYELKKLNGQSFAPILYGLAGALIAIVFTYRKMHVHFMKVKFKDRALFISDLIKAMDESLFIPTASFDNRLFFKRTSLFVVREDTVEVKFEEDNECLIKYSEFASKSLKKHMSPYVTLRNVDFITETNKLMDNE